jgi:hypothetical protein
MTEVTRTRLDDSEKKAFKKWLLKHKGKKIRNRPISESSVIRSLIRYLIGFDGIFEKAEITEFQKTNILLANIAGQLNQLSHAFNSGLLIMKVDVTPEMKKLYEELTVVRAAQLKLIAHVTNSRTELIEDIFDKE